MFKPMLASQIEDGKGRVTNEAISRLNFPVLVSPKFDGIRACMQNGKLVSRSFKPIPNENIQKFFSFLPEGVDGELMYGSPESKSVFQDTTSIVMSRTKPATGVFFYVFDMFGDKPFTKRIENARAAVAGKVGVAIVDQVLVHNLEELLAYEEKALELGFEGVMVRDPNGPYKQGRSSLKQGWLVKLKRFVDAEAEVLGWFEEEANNNVATTNALGRTERSTAKAGMVGKGTLGGFEVKVLNGEFEGVELRIGGGFTALQRADFWKTRSKALGQIIKFKYFDKGTKDKPRHPVYIGFRDKEDM
jgi:DNA ligase-1